MFRLAGLPLGKHRRVLDQPDLIRRTVVTPVGIGLHGLPYVDVRLQPKVNHFHKARQWRKSRTHAYNTIRTAGFFLRSTNSASSCFVPVAVIKTQTDSNRPLRLGLTSTLLRSKPGAWRSNTSRTNARKASLDSPMTRIG